MIKSILFAAERADQFTSLMIQEAIRTGAVASYLIEIAPHVHEYHILYSDHTITRYLPVGVN